ncbi:exodeoxyribonuclease VII small subunit [Pleomorphovibrio marinus]|uniref:exodeoxyribonuclease VII small subunit n=1 Tax=Pleomorphovibrio marinus TaxID=2164132 RepID=UPI000E0C8872|nr:exodeoxyribonuclease VII small subunit [Pleomorphovibrio marinus]
MKNNKVFSYDKAMQRIEQIVEQLEGDDKSIDELADLVKEASSLVKDCKKKLKDTEGEISKAFEDEDKPE